MRRVLVLAAVVVGLGTVAVVAVRVQQERERARIDALWDPCNMAKRAFEKHLRLETGADLTLAQWTKEKERLYWAKMEACRAKDGTAAATSR